MNIIRLKMTGKMSDSRIQFYAEKAEQIMDYLQVLFAFMIGIAFIGAIASLLPGFYRIFSQDLGSSAVMSFLSAVLMAGLVGTTFSLVVSRFKDVDRLKTVVTMAMVGTGVGILEDWLGPAQVTGQPQIILSVGFAAMLFSLLVSLPVVSGEKIIS